MLTPPKEGEALAEAQAEPTPTVPEGLLLGSRLLGVEEGQPPLPGVPVPLGHWEREGEWEGEGDSLAEAESWELPVPPPPTPSPLAVGAAAE